MIRSVSPSHILILFSHMVVDLQGRGFPLIAFLHVILCQKVSISEPKNQQQLCFPHVPAEALFSLGSLGGSHLTQTFCIRIQLFLFISSL